MSILDYQDLKTPQRYRTPKYLPEKTIRPLRKWKSCCKRKGKLLAAIDLAIKDHGENAVAILSRGKLPVDKTNRNYRSVRDCQEVGFSDWDCYQAAKRRGTVETGFILLCVKVEA